MSKLSVIIPTHNEENYIKDAIYSASFADEILVIDSESTDNTINIAKASNCKVISRAFDNFSNQRNYALNHITGDWILFLDADERITFALQNEITNAIKSKTYNAFKLNFPHFFMNRFLYHHKDSVIRLVKNGHSKFEGKVHEKLTVKGSVGKLTYPVLHFTYKGLNSYIKKKDQYAWFQAEELLKKQSQVTYFHLAFKPFYRFFSSFILRRGFLDGIPGLTVACIDAYGVFSRYVKLLLLKKGIK